MVGAPTVDVGAVVTATVVADADEVVVGATDVVGTPPFESAGSGTWDDGSAASPEELHPTTTAQSRPASARRRVAMCAATVVRLMQFVYLVGSCAAGRKGSRSRSSSTSGRCGHDGTTSRVKPHGASADTEAMPATLRFSIVVPAHNEEDLLGRGLAAIDHAVRRAGATAEVVVVANRCTDRSEEIARAAGAIVVIDPHRNIAATRNAGVAASSGEVVVTIDADTVMHPDALVEIDELVRDGRFVGGGSRFVLERTSPGLALTRAAINLGALATRTGGVVYWCSRADFDAVGGFDESKVLGEDVDFAARLRRHGRSTRRRFRNLRRAPSTVSVRKFDAYGDWHFFAETGRLIANPRRFRATVRGVDSTFVDRYFYDFNA